MTKFDVQALRRQFPALRQSRSGLTPAFLDGPGGTQVPQRVIDALVHYLSTCNANHGGVFATSVESDAILADAHEAVADLLNADPDGIVFGQNMTSLTFHLSRAIGREFLGPSNEVIVTRLDHDANVRPWVLAARDAGATVQFVDIHPEDCTLDLEDLSRKLSRRTKVVAIGAASNAVGTVNDVRTVAEWAHAVGALVFVDAVHYAPHGPIDVQTWGCDFLACSAYKFFGPHVGILWGKPSLLASLPAYKVRPAPDRPPDRWMTGTQNHEGIAGVAAAVEYLGEIGERHGEYHGRFPEMSDRRLNVHAGMAAIQEYEVGLTRKLLAALAGRKRFRVWGITDPGRLGERVPTVSITLPGHSSEDLAKHLAARQVYAWSGNFYAVELTERLGLEDAGGLLRLGLVHYNTADEIDRLTQALDEFAP
ncbi:MAG TPA: cysteine desulfurase-like protein [Gemmataceae bacterium]|nr:cysteine desulfurase-like protein [Gemmataceae bacterium]